MAENEIIHAGIKGMKWGVRRYQNKDGTLTPEGKARYGDKIHDDYAKAHYRKSIKGMSDAELKSRNNRLQMESQYRELRGKGKIGKRALKSFIATAGTITATTAAIATYKKLGNSALDKIGNYVLKGLDLSGDLTK